MKSIILNSISFLLLLTSLSVAGETGPKVKIEKVSVCMPHFREEFFSLAVMTARDQGFFKKNDLDVNIVISGDKNHSSLQEGDLPQHPYGDYGVATRVGHSPEKCQLGTSNVERFLAYPDEAQAKTVPLLLTSYGVDYDTNLVVSAKSKIKTVADLKGKTVRLGQTPTRVAMAAILQEAGLTLADIHENRLTPATEVLARLDSGAIDAAITYVPTMPYMLASGKVRVLKANVVKTYLGADVPHSLLIANKDFAHSSGDVVKRFILSMNQATEFIRRNPTEAIYALQRNTTLLGHQPWKVDKVTVEKAGEFIGKISAIDISQSPENRNQARVLLDTYGALLKSNGFITSPSNLAGWLGVAPKNKDRKISSL